VSQLSRAVVVAAIFVALAVPGTLPALAQEETLIGTPTGAGSPFAITRCRLTRSSAFWHGYTLGIVNRTKHQLLSADVALRLYDVENALIGQTTIRLPVQTPLADSDTAVYSESSFGVNMTEPITAVTRVECRAATATFTGSKNWTYGRTWPEKLLPLPTAENVNAGGAGERPAISSSAASRVQIAVTNAWNDMVNGILFVHDTIAVNGGETDRMLRASDLTLTMALSNGARKTYTGMTQGAPTYSKINPLASSTTTAYEVEPTSDLGRLGIIMVPAHGAVTVTVTFAVPDPVANATDNRAVTAR